MRKRKVIVVVTALLLVAAACDKVRVQTYGPTNTSSSNQAVLTPDGPSSYRFVTAPANTAAAVDRPGRRQRPPGLLAGANPVLPDTESCAVWGGQTGDYVQQGAALRIRQEGSRVRAITVTKNVFFNATVDLQLPRLGHRAVARVHAHRSGEPREGTAGATGS